MLYLPMWCVYNYKSRLSGLNFCCSIVLTYLLFFLFWLRQDLLILLFLYPYLYLAQKVGASPVIEAFWCLLLGNHDSSKQPQYWIHQLNTTLPSLGITLVDNIIYSSSFGRPTYACLSFKMVFKAACCYYVLPNMLRPTCRCSAYVGRTYCVLTFIRYLHCRW